MRRLLATLIGIPLAAGLLAGCEEYLDEGGGSIPPPPSGLFYELEPSGDPAAPRGLVLRWDAVSHPGLDAYNVYSRAGTSGAFGLRGTTSSPSFHDDGVPHLEYYVTSVSVDGLESGPSASVVIDEMLRLPAPNALTSISLNRAIHLDWPDNAYPADPAVFAHYRVYSTAYDLDNNLCLGGWTLEGTTVAATFLAASLVNGSPRCFAVSAVTIEGFESLWSPLRYDTPRPDGEEVIVFTAASDPLRSGFRFFLDLNGDGQVGPLELGIVSASGGGQMDFTLGTDGLGRLTIVPQRAAAAFQLWSTQPIRDLTAIDIAPAVGYTRSAILAQPRLGYVFEMNEGQFFQYGAIRVVAMGADYIIFDWSYQTDRGNPELLRTAGISAP